MLAAGKANGQEFELVNQGDVGELVVPTGDRQHLIPCRTGMIAVFNSKGTGFAHTAMFPVMQPRCFFVEYENISDAKIYDLNYQITYLNDLLHWIPNRSLDHLAQYKGKEEYWRGIKCFTGEPPKPEFDRVITPKEIF